MFRKESIEIHNIILSICITYALEQNALEQNALEQNAPEQNALEQNAQNKHLEQELKTELKTKLKTKHLFFEIVLSTIVSRLPKSF